MDTPKKRRGRPPKKAVEAAKKPGKVGRPPGEAAIMKEYRGRMLASPKSAKVLEAIFEAALNDEHKNQAAAWKIIMDRIAPVSGFDKSVAGNAGASININITGLEQPKVDTEEAIDVEFTDV